MPYDIAARLKGPSELRALSLANKNADLQNRIMEASAKYFEETGTSEASQKARQLDIQAEENVIATGNLGARLQELGVHQSQEQRARLTHLVEMSGAIEQYTRTTGDQAGAKQLWDNFVKSTGMADSPEMKDNPLLTYDPETITALATASQIKDPLTPLNWVKLGGEGVPPEVGSVKRDDWKKINELVTEGALFDPGGNLLANAGGEGGLLGQARKDTTGVRDFVNMAAAFTNAKDIISDTLNIMKSTTNAGAGLGISGAALRGLESATSQIRSLVSLAARITPNQQEGIERPDGSFVITDLNPATNPQATEAAWGEFMETMQAGPVKDAILASTALQFNIRLLAYALSKIQGSTNDRISDFDYKTFLNMFNVGSEDQLTTVLSQASRRLDRQYSVMERLMDPTGEIRKQIKPAEGGPGTAATPSTAAPTPTASEENVEYDVEVRMLPSGGRMEIRRPRRR